MRPCDSLCPFQSDPSPALPHAQCCSGLGAVLGPEAQPVCYHCLVQVQHWLLQLALELESRLIKDRSQVRRGVAGGQPFPCWLSGNHTACLH